MGKSDPYMINFYNKHIKAENETALLGFENNKWYRGDCYDRALNNWDINSDWKLTKKYDTIICTRCAYFSKEPLRFFELINDHLNPGGKFYVDFGLGDHWRFDNYKVGWIKDGEHEYAYGDDNLLYSVLWDDEFRLHPHCRLFRKRIEKFGYNDINKAIQEEIPNVLDYKQIVNMFKDVEYDMITLWEHRPQLYILIKGVKK